MAEKSAVVAQLPHGSAEESRGGEDPEVERAGLTDIEKVERVYRSAESRSYDFRAHIDISQEVGSAHNTRCALWNLLFCPPTHDDQLFGSCTSYAQQSVRMLVSRRP